MRWMLMGWGLVQYETSWLGEEDPVWLKNHKTTQQTWLDP